MSSQMTGIDIALAEIRATQAVFRRLESALETLGEGAIQGQSATLPPCDVPVTEGRRQHRSGVPSIIDSDSELQAFIAARMDRMTFLEIAADVAQHFPASRRVGKSAIHDWWKKEGRNA